MRRIATIAALLTINSLCWSETTNTINTNALENLVYLAASAQGDWPKVDTDDLGSSRSMLAMHHTLRLVAVAQEAAKSHGEEILRQFKNSPEKAHCYPDMAYNYAKYSGCPIPTKLQLLEELLTIPNETCDDEAIHLKCLSSYELLTHHHVLSAEKVEFAASTLAKGLEEMIAAQVDIARYWRLFSDIQDLMKLDSTFAEIIKKHFNADLMREMAEAKDNLKKHENPHYYGVSLYAPGLFKYVDDEVREFWCREWCGDKSEF